MAAGLRVSRWKTLETLETTTKRLPHAVARGPIEKARTSSEQGQASPQELRGSGALELLGLADEGEHEDPAAIFAQRMAELDGPLTQDQAYLVASLARRATLPSAAKRLSANALKKLRTNLHREHGDADRGDFILTESLREVRRMADEDEWRGRSTAAMGFLHHLAREVAGAG